MRASNHRHITSVTSITNYKVQRSNSNRLPTSRVTDDAAILRSKGQRSRSLDAGKGRAAHRAGHREAVTCFNVCVSQDYAKLQQKNPLNQ